MRAKISIFPPILDSYCKNIEIDQTYAAYHPC